MGLLVPRRIKVLFESHPKQLQNGLKYKNASKDEVYDSQNLIIRGQ